MLTAAAVKTREAMVTETSQPKLSTEELQLRPLVSEFVVSFVKALSLSGQYTPDHPEVRRSVAALYQHFLALLRGKTELTFLTRIGGESKDVIVDGIFAEATHLAALMPQGTGDLFLPKLHEYFDRRHLLSWSIKANISPEEFAGFIAILSAFAAPAGDRGTDVSAETARALATRGIAHVSLVFMDELVGRDRRLPWRVEMALTRLRKDLRMIPLYRKSGAAELHRAKTQIIDDIIRPVRRPDLLKAVLLNCDLIAKDLSAAGENAIELQLIDHLPLGMVWPTALEFAKDLAGTGSTDGTPQRERARNLLKPLAARLHDQASPEGDQTLSSLFDQKILSLEDLPPRLQETIAAKRFVDVYLANEPQHLERLRGMTEDPAGAAPYVRAVPELLRREKYQSALTILRGVESWSATEFSSAADFKSLLEGVREAVAESDLVSALIERFRGGSTGVRQKVVEVLAALGRVGLPPLIDLLTRSDDVELRRCLVAALAQIGAGALWAVRVPLERSGLPARVVRDLLAVLAQIKDPEAGKMALRFLHHPDATVREEAVAALARASGRQAEAELMAALKDHAPAVRRRALISLGSIGSSNPRVVDFLCEVVRKRHKGEPEEDDQLQIQACQALAEVGRTVTSLIPGIESTLIQALDLDGGKGFLARWGGSAGKSDAVRGAICTALGQIGGRTAAATLGRVLGEKSLLVKDKAARALRQLEARIALHAT
jgi:HEAT repeat protein